MANDCAVMGIDAAWTLTQPSGIALAAQVDGAWQLLAAESSYQRFQALADPCQVAEPRPLGSSPHVPALLSAASALAGCLPDLIAVDMPLSLSPIIGRRISDDAVSRTYGGRKCGTHTPSATRPGRVSDALRESFAHAGFPLRTTAIATPGLIEVYPHPALVELAEASERLPYKAAKIRRYWPSDSPAERRARLYRLWDEIIDLLEAEIAGVRHLLPPLDPAAAGWEVKAYEDALDAVVCAWVAVCALEGRAAPFGDAHSAIWIPYPASPYGSSCRPTAPSTAGRHRRAGRQQPARMPQDTDGT